MDHLPAAERIVQALETEAEECPERQVVQPDESVDPEPCSAVVPRRLPEKPPQDTTAHIFDAEDAEAIGAPAHRERSIAQSIMERLEQGLCQAVHRDVQKAARTTPPRVQPDVERIDGPPRQPVDEEALARLQGASPSGARSRGHRNLVVRARLPTVSASASSVHVGGTWRLGEA